MLPEPRDVPVPLADRVQRRVLAGSSESIVDAARVREAVRAEAPLLPAGSVEAVASNVIDRAQGLGSLEPLLADPDGHRGDGQRSGSGVGRARRAARAHRDGPRRRRRSSGSSSGSSRRSAAASTARRQLVDARLPDGSRVNAVVPPLAVDGPCLTIRRVPVARPARPDGLLPAGVAELLSWAVVARANIVVSGGTGAGKTTLLNALAAEHPDERARRHGRGRGRAAPARRATSSGSRPGRPTPTGCGAVTIRDLVRNALRMRPDRIVVGECRGGEALDMLQAMNTGHEGSLSTCHANGPVDALRRLETMAAHGATSALPLRAVREQIAAALDLVVQVARPDEGRRRIVAVAEVVPYRARPAGCADARRRHRAEGAPRTSGPRKRNTAPDPGWCRA